MLDLAGNGEPGTWVAHFESSAKKASLFGETLEIDSQRQGEEAEDERERG